MNKKKQLYKSLAMTSILLFPSAAYFTLDTEITNAAAQTINLKDIKGHWSEEYVKRALNKGYVVGYEDGTFKPDKTVTNAEFIKMLATALNPNAEYEEVKGGNWYVPYMEMAQKLKLIKASENFAPNEKMVRMDLAKLGVRAIGLDTSDPKEWMYLATTTGLISGVDNKGTLQEKGTMTRGQAVTLIERALQYINGEKLTVDKNAVANAEILWHKTNIFSVMPQWFLPERAKEIDMSDNALTSSAENGNIVSKTTKLIAIDLDNMNDPNRHLLKGKTLSTYNYLTDKKTYFDVNLEKNGYIIISLNELTIKDTNKITKTAFGGAFVDVLFSVDEKNIYKDFKLLENTDGSSFFLSATKGQTKKKYEYTTGLFVSKNYKLQKGESIGVYFNGLIDWGGGKRGELFTHYNY